MESLMITNEQDLGLRSYLDGDRPPTPSVQTDLPFPPQKIHHPPNIPQLSILPVQTSLPLGDAYALMEACCLRYSCTWQKDPAFC